MIKPTLPSRGRFQERGVKFVCLFLLLAGCVSRIFAADVELYTVTKGRWHQQLNSGLPTFLPEKEYVFQAELFTLSNAVRAAFVETTDYVDRVFEKQDPEQWRFRDRMNDAAALDGRYPNGPYYFWITNWQNRLIKPATLQLNAGGTYNYPPPPHISNWDELQFLNGNGFVVVRWDRWGGGTSSDYIQLRVYHDGNKVFETRDFGEINALDGTATNAIVKPGKLSPGSNYIGRLEFRKTVNIRTNSDGSIGWAYLHRRTEFPLSTTSDSAPDIDSYDVAKGHDYVQTNLGPAVLEGSGTNGYAFSASLESIITNGILGNTLTRPNGREDEIFPEECRPETQLSLSFRTSSQVGLDAEYPDGRYTFDIQTARQGEHLASLNLQPSYYPPAPHIRNFDPSIAVVPGQPIYIEWDRWSDGTANDFIQLRLETGCRNIFETDDFGDPDALNGSATSITIPSTNSLGEFIIKPGETVSARLTFRRIVQLNTTDYPGALGVASFFSRTKFDIAGRLDTESYEVAKGRRYVQTNTTAVIPDGTNAFEVQAEVDAQTPSSVISSALHIPNDGTINMTNDGLGQFTIQVLSPDSLDTVYPDGTYTFDLVTEHDGPKSLSLNLQGSSYPPIPHFQHDPTVRVRPDQDFTMQWEADGTLSDFVQLRIRNNGTNVWKTPDLGEDGALTGLSTSATIPASMLIKGQTYTARLTFQRIVDTRTNDYAGSVGTSYYFTRTDIDLKTVKPDVESYSIEKGQSFLLLPTEDGPVLVPEEGSEFLFNASVQGSTSNVILSAKMTVPNGVVTNLLDLVPPPDKFELSASAFSQQILDTNYPAGVYRFEVGTLNDHTNTASLNLISNTYPPAPFLQNYSVAAIMGGIEVPLRWDDWAGGTTNDFVQVQLRDAGTNVWETPKFEDPGALNGLSNNVVIPAGVTRAGKHYTIRITFRRYISIGEPQPGTEATVSYFTRTKGDLYTSAPDVSSYSMFKGREYLQTNANIVVATSFVFTATVVATEPDSVRSLSIITPNNEMIGVSPQPDSQTYTYLQSLPSQQAFDARFPEGPYILAIDGVAYGHTNVTIYLTNSAYPNSPYILNYAATQRINPATDFTLSWTPFANATLEDGLTVSFTSVTGNRGFISKPPTEEGGIDATATEVTIPGGTVRGNDVFAARILFEKVVLNDETTYVEVPGRAGYYSRTTFRALTAGAGNPPQIPPAQFEVLDGQVQFVITTTPSITYVIEGSRDLVNWATLSSFTAGDQRFTYTAPAPPAPFFYRVRMVR